MVPFVHMGMDKVLPRGASIPSPGQTVHILAGAPISMSELLEDCAQNCASEAELHQALADRLGHTLRLLKRQLEASVAEEVACCLPLLSPACLILAPTIEVEAWLRD